MEYYLQKRTLSSWSHVTIYENKDEGLKNLNSASKDSGYSWRLVEVKVVEERILTDEMKEQREQVDTKPQATGGWTKPEQQTSWGQTKIGGAGTRSDANTWGNPPAPTSSHGLSGSVWLVNHTIKEKKRVPAAQVDVMIADGWVRGGPRTVI